MAGNIDVAAEKAIRQAFEDDPPYNSTTIPQRALDVLDDRDAGTERVFEAIGAMSERGALDAPSDPWRDWKLNPDMP